MIQDPTKPWSHPSSRVDWETDEIQTKTSKVFKQTTFRSSFLPYLHQNLNFTLDITDLYRTINLHFLTSLPPFIHQRLWDTLFLSIKSLLTTSVLTVTQPILSNAVLSETLWDPPPPPLQPPDSVTFSKVLDRFRSAFWVGSSSQPLDYSTVQIKTLPLLLLQSPTLPLPPPNLNLLSVPQIQQHPILDPSNHYLHSSWLNTRSPTSIHLLYLALPSNNNMQFFGFSLTFSSSSNPQYSRQSFHPIAFLLCSSPQTHPSRLVCCVFFASSSRYPRLGSTTSLCISISSWYQGGFTLFFSLLIRSQTYLRSSLPNGLANVPRSTQ